MSYTKTTWRNNQAPAINADNLNHMEQGIESAHNQIDVNTSNIESLTTQVQNNATNIASEISARQTTDSSLQSQIDQLVAPTGEAPTPAEIENARIGDDGVTYDTLGNAIRGQFSDVKSDISFIVESNGVPYQNVEQADFTDNKIYKVDGTYKIFGGGWVSTEFLPCSGAKIKYTAVGFNSNGYDLAYVAFFDINKQMTHCLKSSDIVSGSSIVTSGEITAQDGDFYVRVVGETSKTPVQYVIIEASGIYPDIDSIPQINNRLISAEKEIGLDSFSINYESFNSSELFLEDGTFYNFGTPWKSTGFIPCQEGMTIRYKATAFNGTGRNKLAYVAFFDNDYNVVSFLKSSDYVDGYNAEVEGMVVAPSGASYVLVEGKAASCYMSYNANGLKPFDSFKVSDLNVLCIGDSLTSGVINSDVDIIKESYPYWVGKILSSFVSNAGYPGGQTTSWWARRLMYDQPTEETDVVLIMFGTNGGLETNTLATDVEPYSDYNDYANTGVGCMCKIIEWVMEETENHAQIILLTPPMNWVTTGTEEYAQSKYNVVLNSNPVVKAIAQRYALPVIDVFYECGMNKYNGDVFRPDDGMHFSAKGYHKLGSFIAHKIASMYSTFDNNETGTVI